MPPMYHYSFTPLQWSYSLNIPGHTRDFPITVWVRYSSERPTTPGSPLHPGRRRPRGLLTTPYHDAGVAWSSPVFAFRPEEQRRQATSALAPGIGFSVLGVLSSPSDPKTSEDGPPPCLLLASASESLTSYLLRCRHVVYRTDGWAPNCWWRVSPERRDTTTVMNEYAKQRGKVLSLYSMCPINEPYRGYL